MIKIRTTLCRILFMSLLSASAFSYADTTVAPMTSSTKEANIPQVSINQASAEHLAEIMVGIGIKKAQNIVDYREQHGPFTSIEQLQNVPGIGIATLERNMSRLTL